MCSSPNELSKTFSFLVDSRCPLPLRCGRPIWTMDGPVKNLLGNFLWRYEHWPGIAFRRFSSLKSKGNYLFVDRGKLKSMKSYEKMGRWNRSIINVINDHQNDCSKSFENRWSSVFVGRRKNSSLHHWKKSKIIDDRHFFSKFTKTDHN
jgi:hypothetical protein